MTAPSPAESAATTVLARAEWPAGAAPPPIAGFVVSTFSPLVAAVAERCLAERFGAPPGLPDTGVVLASVRGDVTTADTVADAVRDRRRVPPLLFFQSNPNAVVGHVTASADTVADAVRDRRRVPPLLFFQSNPNAVVGHVTARWGLTGPVVCTSPAGDPLADGTAVAELLIADGAATQVLVIAADLAEHEHDTDHAVALLVGPPEGSTP